MIKLFFPSFKSLQFLVLFISIIFFLESLKIIHLPFIRYFLSVVFLFVIVKSVRKHDKSRYLRLLFYCLIVLSIFTFLRGLSYDDFIFKQYLSSTYSFYLFPLLLIIPNDWSVLKFLKSSIFFSFTLNLIVLITLPFWLNSPFYTDMISRMLMSVSGITFLFRPFLQKNRNIVLINFLIALVVNIIVARRAETFFLIGIFLQSLIFDFNSKRIKLILTVTFSIILSYILLLGFGIGQTLLNRYKQGYDNRSFYIDEALAGMKETKDFLFGKGATGTYYSETASTFRNVVEHGYYNLLFKSGSIFIFLFVLISLKASYNCFYKSRNLFSKKLGFYILLYLLLMFGHGLFEFNYRVLFLWFAISFSFNMNILRLDNGQINSLLLRNNH